MLTTTLVSSLKVAARGCTAAGAGSRKYVNASGCSVKSTPLTLTASATTRCAPSASSSSAGASHWIELACR